jgi:hypothetical protein
VKDLFGVLKSKSYIGQTFKVVNYLNMTLKQALITKFIMVLRLAGLDLMMGEV